MPPKKNPNSKRLSLAELKARALKPEKLLAPLHPSADAINDLPFLGQARAVVIVTAAANTSPSNLPRTLAQLGVNGISFQSSVFNGVNIAGYTIGLDAIPNSPSTTLLKVVGVIQNAPKKP
jgi:hypothetical protein